MRKHALLILCIITLFTFELYAQKQNPIDSLKTILSKAPQSEQFEIYLSLAEETQKNDPQEAANYLKKAGSTIAQNKKSRPLFRYYNAISRNLLYRHKYDSLLWYAEKALSMRELASPKGLIHTHATIGTSYYYTGDYEKAIEEHLKALKITDEKQINEQYTNVYNNISVVYLAMNNNVKAEEYLKKAINAAERNNNTKEGSRAMGNLAIVYGMQEKYDLAAEMFKRDIDLNEKIGNKMAASKAYNNLGVLHEYKEDFELSLKNYRTGLALAKEIDDKASVALGYQNVASALRKLGKFEEAMLNYKIGMPLNRIQGNRTILRDGLLGISELYEQLGDSGKALKYHQEYHLLNDSLISAQHLSSVSELEIKYESEKKEKDILSLSQQRLKDEAAIAKQNMRIRRLSIGLIGAVLLFGSAFIIFRQRSKNQKQKELISAIADTQIAERKRISQDLHDSVGGSLALAKTKLQAIYERNEDSKELQESLKTLTHAGEQIRQISHNLMPGELVKFGLISAIQTTLDQLQETELQAQLYAHDMEKRIDPTKEIHLFRIVQEIIQNVLKHAKAKQLNVYLNKHRKYLNLMIEDDGIGMGPENSKTSGLGLNNVRSRVAFLQGTLDIDSAQGGGTTLNIQIPL